MTLRNVRHSEQPALSTNRSVGHRIHPQLRPHHTSQPHEIRRAWLTAKQLEDRLEIAGLLDLSRTARWIREQAFLALLEAEGFVEVNDEVRQ